MATIIRPSNPNNRPVRFPNVPAGEAAAIVARIRGITSDAPTYNPGSSIRFTTLSYLRNIGAYESRQEAVSDDGLTFTAANGFAHFKLPQGTYEAILIFNGTGDTAPSDAGSGNALPVSAVAADSSTSTAAASGTSFLFELQENGVAQGSSVLAIGSGQNTAIIQFDVDKPFSIVRLSPLQTTTMTISESNVDLMTLAIKRIGLLTPNSRTN